MSNSSLITGALIFLFVLYLAAKNRLGTYAAVLWGGTSTASAAGSTSAPTTSSAVATPGTTAAPLDSVALNPAPANPSPTTTNPNNANALLKQAFLSVGNGVTTQQFSSALDDAASMAAPAGMLGF